MSQRDLSCWSFHFNPRAPRLRPRLYKFAPCHPKSFLSWSFLFCTIENSFSKNYSFHIEISKSLLIRESVCQTKWWSSRRKTKKSLKLRPHIYKVWIRTRSLCAKTLPMTWLDSIANREGIYWHAQQMIQHPYFCSRNIDFILEFKQESIHSTSGGFKHSSLRTWMQLWGRRPWQRTTKCTDLVERLKVVGSWFCFLDTQSRQPEIQSRVQGRRKIILLHINWQIAIKGEEWLVSSRTQFGNYFYANQLSPQAPTSAWWEKTRILPIQQNSITSGLKYSQVRI